MALTINPIAINRKDTNNKILRIIEGVVCSEIIFPVNLKEPKIAVAMIPLIPIIVK